jgi:hypothetical protein
MNVEITTLPEKKITGLRITLTVTTDEAKGLITDLNDAEAAAGLCHTSEDLRDAIQSALKGAQ